MMRVELLFLQCAIVVLVLGITTTAATNPILLELPDEEINRYLNSCLVTILIPLVFRKILDKATPNKKVTDTYENCVVSSKGQLKKKKFSTEDVRKLKENTDASKFDVTFLFKLITEINESTQVKSDKHFENLLTKAKDIRNKICHASDTDATDYKDFEKAKVILSELISSSGVIYKQAPIDTERELQYLQEQFKIISKYKVEDVMEVNISFYISFTSS